MKNAVEHKNTKSKGLVIYFGAGSSLYSNRWGDPFEKVYKDLAEKINNAIQYNQKEIERNRNEKNAASNPEKIKKLEEQYQKLEKDRKTFEEIKAEVDNVGYMLDEKRSDYKEIEPDYLGIGNILDRNIKKFEPTDIARQYGVNNYQSFNHACCDILDDKNKRKTVEDYNFEGYVTKHLFYVAYLFKELEVGLTTVNVDTCFSDVCKKLGHTLPTATMYVPEANKVRIQFPCNEYAIVHIHGCITDSEYDKILRRFQQKITCAQSMSSVRNSASSMYAMPWKKVTMRPLATACTAHTTA